MNCTNCVCERAKLIETDSGDYLHNSGIQGITDGTECVEFMVIFEEFVDEYKKKGYEIYRDNGTIYAICPCDEPEPEQ